MKIITQNEAIVLRNAKFEKYVIHGKGKYLRYYVVENKQVLQFLEDYRIDIRIS